MDQNLAYMYMMSARSRGKVLFTRDTLHKQGGKVKLFPVLILGLTELMNTEEIRVYP